MADTAARLTDEILPRVPVRQWVLSLPYEIRYRLAWDGKLIAKQLEQDATDPLWEEEPLLAEKNGQSRDTCHRRRQPGRLPRDEAVPRRSFDAPWQVPLSQPSR